MATITTDIEFELEDIDTYDLVDEISNRIGRFKRKKLTAKQVESLRVDFAELAEALNLTDNVLAVKTLDDKLKIEHLANVWHKYSLSQIENLLP